jgi:transcriptional regulator with XRE-family HTH domain
MKKPIFYKHRLFLARTFHGMSMQKLGDKIGVSRQYIHQLESGVKKPDKMMINVLAFALDVYPSFFSDSEPNPTDKELNLRICK